MAFLNCYKTWDSFNALFLAASRRKLLKLCCFLDFCFDYTWAWKVGCSPTCTFMCNRKIKPMSHSAGTNIVQTLAQCKRWFAELCPCDAAQRVTSCIVPVHCASQTWHKLLDAFRVREEMDERNSCLIGKHNHCNQVGTCYLKPARYHYFPWSSSNDWQSCSCRK